MTRIKVCGLVREDDVDAVNAARPDFAGFVVDVPASRRSVSPAEVRALAARLDAGIQAVGVFVDAPAATVAELLNDGTLDAAQLHGSEDAAYVSALRELTDKPLVQAFRVASAADVARAEASAADHVLLDSGAGSGRTFDWKLARACKRPFFLAGGLEPGIIARAVEAARPFGVDLSSGVETNGAKDPEKIARAVAEAHGADAPEAETTRAREQR
ncbi:phosphoribosylanthranilate isomerase [Gordonibacter massiliensis (ex Traore et al. 2017)]|uniref:phosphoribosylanthranilate isomerase n=1 Tax=Gordonibacter massiliensis (ex Traore et al. 2017) TaxID=1841863 RepID=UPI001C8C9521|nr:phosphoribosylanthranilate isomerase [Gordonibacter massiliensis (ex Traore et al. 2017)]MBX9034331.1 phosphoribosylanthranilate isomerase [Gordonibacter massiliensis (ex Traore et al. 2017)]